MVLVNTFYHSIKKVTNTMDIFEGQSPVEVSKGTPGCLVEALVQDPKTGHLAKPRQMRAGDKTLSENPLCS